MILMPPMTAYSGFYFFYPLGTKGHTKVSYQNKLTEKLLSQLPANSLYYQQYHPSFTNWQPLYWKGYKETSRYTYLLDKTLGEAVLTKNLKGNLRRSFRHIIEACDIVTLDFDTFWPELDNSFQSRAKPNPYNKAVLSNLFTAFSGTEQLTVKACRHKQTGEYISGVVLASDRVTTYYIASFYKPSVKPSGSLGYVFWKSIFECNTQICDFEGSMIKEVEFFLRAFGGELTPHHKVHKVHHPLLRWGLRFLKPDFFV